MSSLTVRLTKLRLQVINKLSGTDVKIAIDKYLRTLCYLTEYELVIDKSYYIVFRSVFWEGELGWGCDEVINDC